MTNNAMNSIRPVAGRAKNVNGVDIHVGRRIRTIREIRGVTQTELAKAIGLTFQQVQKYERGLNRVGAGRLWEIAAFLNCEIIDFYVGVAEPDGGGEKIADPLTSPDALKLCRDYLALSDIRKNAARRIFEIIAKMKKE